YELPFPYMITPPILASLAESLPAGDIQSLQPLVGQGYTDVTSFTSAVDAALGGDSSTYGGLVVTAGTSSVMSTLPASMGDNPTAYAALLGICGIPYLTQTALQAGCLG